MERTPRLGLVARLGFAASFGVAVLVGVVSWHMRSRTPDAVALASQSPNPVLAPADAAPATAEASASGDTTAGDAIGAMLAGRTTLKTADVTGSIGPAASAAKQDLGSVSGLPIPRFVSLKADRVNVRQGPTRDHDVAFIFQRAGLPVEVVAEFENWRRIRDSEGTEGWVMQSMLSGRRTALVTPWNSTIAPDKALSLYQHADAASGIIAKLQPGVQASIKECASSWCRISGDGFDGWIGEDRLWGAYPGETVD